MHSKHSLSRWFAAFFAVCLSIVLIPAASAAVPTITSLSPASAVAGGAAFTLTVNGTNFVTGATVHWGDFSLVTTYVSATKVTAAVPATRIATAGTASVSVTTGGGGSAGSTFTILPPKPVITSLSPSTAVAGGAAFTLTVNGTNLVTGAVVKWGTNSLTTTYVSDAQLTAIVPATLIAAVGTGSVTVVTTGGTSAASTFTIAPPPPTITSISPTTAVAGGAALTLTVNGTNFTSTSSVKWNGAALTTTYSSATKVTAAVPAANIASVGTATVTVTTAGGTSAGSTFTILPPKPTITSISPTTVVAGGPDFSLAVNGTNFVTGTAINWNGTALTTTPLSATKVVTTVMASAIATAGTASVTVTSPGGTSTAATLTINPPPPTITSISPTSANAGGAAFTLAVNGTNFVSGAVVKWGTTSLTTTYVSATQLTAAVPATSIATAGSANVTVTTTGGTSAATPFTILPPKPTITSLSPATAVAGGAAFTLTVNGANYVSGAAVNWNGTALTTTYVSATKLTAAVPAGNIAAVGTASVTVTTTGGTSTASTFTINPPAPVITSLSPSTAVAGGAAFTLTVNGTNLVSGAVVKWGTTSLTTTYVSNAQLTAAVPASLIAAVGTGSVTVVTAGGTSAASTFTINPPPPTITSLSPATAVAGGAALTLTVNGTNFTSTTTVKWNGTALTTTYASATKVTAAVPATSIATVGTATVTATTAGGTSAGATFSITPPKPTITSISPTTAVAGGAAFTLTVNGTYFVSGATINWNGSPLSTTIVSATQATATVGEGLISSPGTASVTVVTAGGTSTASTFTINPKPPTITSISPTTANAGGAAFTLTVNGTNYVSGAVVKWGTTSLTTTYVSATQLTAAVPATSIATAGTANVTVTTTGGTTAAAVFTILPPKPTIASLSPATTAAGGAALTLTVNGANYVSGATVSWNGTALATTYVSATKVTAAVTADLIAAVGTASVTVTTTGGTSTASTFTISQPVPTITSISPSSTLAGGSAFTLTVNGTWFTAASAVKWGTTALTTTYVSATQLTAAVPATLIAASGTASVTVTTTGGTSTASTFTIAQPPPTITSLSPTTAVAGSGALTLTVNGTWFTAAASVKWNGTALTTTYVSATKLTAAVPATLTATAGTASVTVTTAGGSTAASTFTITPPKPTITSLSPNSAAAGSAAFTLTVTGANYLSGAGATTVNWNGAALTTTYVSATQVTAVVPATLIITAGSASVTVVTAGGTSTASTFTIIPVAATPAISLASGTYTGSQTVTIADGTAGAAIHYTTNGTAPTATSTTYTGALTVSASETLQALATATGYAQSAIASATYTILKAQTINFSTIASPVTYGVAPITMTGTATSALAVTFSVVSGPARVAGSTLTITGAGTVVVAANQAGNSTWAAAPQVTQSITVNKAKPVITWAAPAAISYGTALSTAQLNATTTVAGAFDYLPAAGTVLTTGTQTLTVTFFPTDTTDYTDATTTVNLTVNPATPPITWATPDPITYGTTLSPTQLNATSTVSGSFAYTPNAGALLSVGSQTLSVTFTPTDATDYTTATKSVTLTVNKANAAVVITSSANASVFGQNVVFMATVSAVAPASGTPSGSITFYDGGVAVGSTVSLSSGVATVGTSVLTVGSHTITASYSGDGNFNVNTGSLTGNPQVVGKASTITGVASSENPSVWGDTVTLTATVLVSAPGAGALSGTVTFYDGSVAIGNAVSLASGMATLTTSTLTAGLHTIMASYSGDGNSSASNGALTGNPQRVIKATPTVGVAPTPIMYGTPLTAEVLGGQVTLRDARPDGTLSYSPALGTILPAGAQTIRVTFTPTDTIDINTVSFEFQETVTAAALTVTADSKTMNYLGAMPVLTGTLSGMVAGDPITASYTTTAVATSPVAIYPITANLIDPSGKLANYTVTNTPGTLTITKATPVITWATPAPITAGTELTGLQLNAKANVPGSFTYSPDSGAVLPAGAQTLTATFTPDDLLDYTTATASVTLTVNASGSTPSFTTSTLPDGTLGVMYGQTIQVTGGGPGYIWTVNGSKLLTDGTPVSIAGGLLVSNKGDNLLAISGTPTSVGKVTFTVLVEDAETGNLSGTVTYAINVTAPGYTVNGQINTMNCGGNGLSGITVSISTDPVQTTVTDSNGQYSFTNVPNGSYTVTPSIVGPSAVFLPASQAVTVNSSQAWAQFQGELGYTYSGTVRYSGSVRNGQVYLRLVNTSCGNGVVLGTSIKITADSTFPIPFTIRGVPPGTYNLESWLDNLGTGAKNASNPWGLSSGVKVLDGNVTNAIAFLTDPSIISVSSAPTIQGVMPFSQGALVSYQPVTNASGVETAEYYTLEWSQASDFSSINGSQDLLAQGANGTNLWLINGLSDGTTYYFQARAHAGAISSVWSSPSGPVTIGAQPGENTVSGTVTFKATPTGPLYVGFFDQSTNQVYATVINNPVSPAQYSVQVPSGSNYFFFGILDQNNNGLIDAGDVTNTNIGDSAATVVAGSITGEDLTLPTDNATVRLTTQHSMQINDNGTGEGYGLSFNVRGLNKMPVAVALVSGPNVLDPEDIGQCTNCGSDSYDFWVSLGSVRPAAPDAYGLQVTYSDGTSETLSAPITTVLDAFATNLKPTGTGDSTKPTFSWTDPKNSGAYSYEFQIWDQNGNNIWQVPGNNSKSNGLTNDVTSLAWGVDPNDSNNLPTVSSLTKGTNYNWQIRTRDQIGNSTQMQVSYLPGGQSVPLSLPSKIPASLGSATVNQPYSGSITAIGGFGPYTWSVSGLTDNLTSADKGGNTLTISGTPFSDGKVTFQVQVQDSTGASASQTYSILVVKPSVLSLSDPINFNSAALTGQYYAGYINAAGAPAGSLYTFTVNGSPVPVNSTPIAVANGLFAINSGGNTLAISGTPTMGGQVTLNVTVGDTVGDTLVSNVYSLNIASGYSTMMQLPTPNPVTLGPALVGVQYGGYVTASGGTAPYSWNLTGLDGTGLYYSAYNNMLLIGGAPIYSGQITFQASVTDANGIGAGPVTYTINVGSSSVLWLPSTPSYTGFTATQGLGFNNDISVTGGPGGYNYYWMVNGGGIPSDGAAHKIAGGDGLLASSIGGGTITISGTPAYAGMVTLYVQVGDNAGDQPVAGTFMVLVNPGSVSTLSLPTPNPVSLGSASVGTTYYGTIAAIGGVGPYTWIIGGTAVTSGGLGMSDNLTATSDGSAVLTIAGTPTYATTIYPYISVKDSTGAMAGPLTYMINVTDSTPYLYFNYPALPPAYVGYPYAYQLVASGGTQPYTWSLPYGSLPDGLTLSSTGMITGTPTTAVSNFNTYAQVADSGSPQQTATNNLYMNVYATLSKCSNDGTGNAKLSGNYAFQISSVSLANQGNQTIVGEMTADGAGNITAGLFDTNGPNSTAANSGALTGVYSIGSDNRGSFSFTVPSGNAANPTQTISFCAALDSFSSTSNVAQGATLVEDDASETVSSGALYAMPTATLSNSYLQGGWAIGLQGSRASGNSQQPNLRHASAGYMNLDGAGNLTVGELDRSDDLLDISGYVYNKFVPQVAFTGAYTLASNGRGTVAMTAGTSGTNNFVFYVTANNQLLMLQTDPGMISSPAAGLSGVVYSKVMAGNAYRRSTTSFDNSTLSGTSVGIKNALAYSGGWPYGGDVAAGLFTWDGSGNVTATIDENVAGAVTSGASNTMAATYAVDANGRVVLNTGNSSQNIFYLIGQNQAVGVDDETGVGYFYFDNQGTAAGTFTAASFSGEYSVGTLWLGNSYQNAMSGEVYPDGAGNFVAFIDQNDGGVISTNSVTVSTYTPDASGRFPMMDGTNVLYMVSGKRGYALDLSSTSYPMLQRVTRALTTATVPLAVATGSLPSALSGAYYLQQFQAVGGSGGYTWTLESGSTLPDSFSFDAKNGTISGTATVAQIGTYYFTLQVADSGGNTAVKQFTLTVVQGATLKISNPYPPNGTVGQFYSYQLYAFESRGNCPPVCVSLKPAAGRAHSMAIPTGPSTTFIVLKGTLPDGITMDSTGYISGTPKTAESSTFTVQATDSNGLQAIAGITLTIDNGGVSTSVSLPEPNPQSLGSATVGQSYTGFINASGGTAPYTWTVNGIAVPKDGSVLTPETAGGLNFSNTGGNTLTVGGTPMSPGAFSFQVWVADVNGNSAGPITYTVKAIQVTPVSLPSSGSITALVNAPFSQSLNASGGTYPYAWVVNSTIVPVTGVSVSLGDGLTISNTGGNTLYISGTPASVATITMDVQVTDGSGTTAGPVTFTINVLAGPDGSHNALVKGTYACLTQGFNDGDGSRWASVASVMADGNGNLTGSFDENGSKQDYASSGSVSGTYSVGGDNMGLATMTPTPTGGTGQATSWALALNGLAGTATSPVAQQFRMVETDDAGEKPSGQHGTANCYLADPSAFVASTLNGSSFAFGISGENSNEVAKAAVGRFSVAGGTISTGKIDIAKGAPATVETSTFTGSFTLPDATSGRLTLTLDAGGGNTITLVDYIVDANRSFLLETTAGDGLLAGNVRKQQQTSYSAANLSGPYVLYAEGVDYDSNNYVAGYFSSVFQGSGDGAGNLTVNESFMDDNGTYKQDATGTYAATFDSSAPGRVTIPTGALQGTSAMGYFYMFDNGNAFDLDVNGYGWPDWGWVEPQKQTMFNDTNLAGTYMLGQLPPLSASANGNVGELTFSAGAVNGTVTTGGPWSFTWEQPISTAYTWDSATYGTFLISTGDKSLSCAVISAKKLVCTPQNDSSPGVMILQK